MLLAVSQMSPTVQGVLFTLAVVCFVLAAIGVALGRIEPVAVGLALFVLVFAWNAWAAS